MSAAAALRGALRHAPRAAPRRRMGGLTNVKKNAHVEEWNGRREITEKTFDVGRPRTVATLLATIVAFPFVVHHVVKSEGRDDFWTPSIFVEAGELTVHVGGGQPDFTEGVLSASVTVKDSGPLTTQYAC